MNYFKFVIFILGALLFLSCADDPVKPIVEEPEPEDTIPEITGYQQYGIPLVAVPETNDLIMYEVNLRAFSASGTLNGVKERLDELDALGVNVIWLMPIYPIGAINSVNSPYSVKNYTEVSAEYGTLENLRALTDAAHDKNIAVILDWVANHTAWDNPWISNADWYTQDANGNIIMPPGTNWADVADLNYSNMQLQDTMIDALKYWILEANVDGYRCDYADGVPYTFWKRALDSLATIPNRKLIMLAEGSRTDHYAAGFQMTYAWDFYGKLINVFGGQAADGLFDTHKYEYNSVPVGKHKLRYSTNHDESAWNNTPMVLYNGKNGALAASVATIFMGGVPLIYTGQEVGQYNTVPFFSQAPIDWNQNPDMLQTYKDLFAFYSESGAAKSRNLTDYSDANVVCFEKNEGDETLLIFINMKNASVSFTVPEAFVGTNLTNALSQETVNLSTSIDLEPYEYLIAKN